MKSTKLIAYKLRKYMDLQIIFVSATVNASKLRKYKGTLIVFLCLCNIMFFL